VTRRQFLLLILPLLLVLAGFVALHVVERVAGIGAPAWDADFADHMRRQMGREFVFGVGDEEKQKRAYFAALNAYLRQYDPFGEVTPPHLVERAREASSGQYYGIGIRMPNLRGTTVQGVASLEILGIAPGGPAEEAGLRVGERIVAVDGRPVEDILATGGQDALAGAIKGEEGTAVRLTVRALDGAEREAVATRGAVSHGSVFCERMLDREAGTGYVRVAHFHHDTAETLQRKIETLREEGLRSLVLDLRGNRGGLLDQAVELADLFVDPKGRLSDPAILRQIGRNEVYSRAVFASGDETAFPAMPLVVLVDRDSASASEILAGALQDHRRAAIVGERTYGKFQVQNVTMERSRFGRVLFRRTISIYTTPRGRSYPRRPDHHDPLAGIPPDFTVVLGDEERKVLDEVFEQEAYREWNPTLEPRHADFVDRQLEAAAGLLRHQVLTAQIG